MRDRPAIPTRGTKAAVAAATAGGLCIAALAGAPGQAWAVDDWSAPRTLTAGSQSWLPAVATDRSGRRAWSIWTQDVGAWSLINGSTMSGGVWTPPVAATKPGADADEPQVAISPDGRSGVAAWERADVIQASHWNGTSWGPPVTVSEPAESSRHPSVAVADRGDRAVIAWSGQSGALRTVESAVWNGSAWTAPVSEMDLAPGRQHPMVAMSADGGQAWLAYVVGAAPLRRVVARRIVGEQWQVPTAVSPVGQHTTDPHLAMAGDGVRAVVGWDQGPPSAPRVHAALWNGTQWRSAAALAPSGRVSRINDIAMSDDGSRAAVMWDQRFPRDTHGVRFRLWEANSWRRTVDVSKRSPAPSSPRFGWSKDGLRAVAVWTQWDDTNDRVQTATWNGSAWSEPRFVSRQGLDAQLADVAVSAKGFRAVAIWSRFGSIQARSLDVLPGRIRKIGVDRGARRTTVTWQVDPDATAYRVRALRNGRAVTKRVVTTARARLGIPAGRYVIKVQGKSPAGLGPITSASLRAG